MTGVTLVVVTRIEADAARTALRHALARIASYQLRKDLAIAVFQAELEVSTFHMADVAQHGKELPLALHHFGLAGHTRCGELMPVS